MIRKIFICALMLAAVMMSGCGGKVVGTPDKAVLAYSEIITMGESPNLAAAGFSEEDNKNLRKKIVNVFAESFAGVVPLSDESAEALANAFYDNSKAKLTLQAKIKTDDAEHPVVELTTTPFDLGKAAGTPNDDFIALMGMVGKLKSDGATDEQLKANAEVQKLAITAFKKYFGEIPVREEKTFEVPCDKVTGTDGQTHWAPADVNALTDFILGNKT